MGSQAVCTSASLVYCVPMTFLRCCGSEEERGGHRPLAWRWLLVSCRAAIGHVCDQSPVLDSTPMLDQAPVLAYVGGCCKSMSWCFSMSMQMLAADNVQLGWTVMAPSQQVQPGAAHASALPEPKLSELDSEGRPRQENQEAPLAQLWHGHQVGPTCWLQQLSASSSSGSV